MNVELRFHAPGSRRGSYSLRQQAAPERGNGISWAAKLEMTARFQLTQGGIQKIIMRISP
jgi:hypothetical protein